MTLGEFHTMVSDALGRGTALDSIIPVRTRMAARWIERNYLFQYMRTWKVLDVLATATYPYILSLANLEIRNIESLRIRTLDGDGTTYLFSPPLKRIAPADRGTRGLGVPESYWLNGVTSVILGSIPDVDTTFEANLQQFTKWGSGSSWTHWLLDNAEQLLLCRTLMMMTVRSRDQDLWAMYKSEFDLEIQSFNVSEEVLATGDLVQIWEPPAGDTFDNSLRSA